MFGNNRNYIYLNFIYLTKIIIKIQDIAKNKKEKGEKKNLCIFKNLFF